jgi:hypothetical protein
VPPMFYSAYSWPHYASPDQTWTGRFRRPFRAALIVAIAGTVGVIGGGLGVVAVTGNLPSASEPQFRPEAIESSEATQPWQAVSALPRQAEKPLSAVEAAVPRTGAVANPAASSASGVPPQSPSQAPPPPVRTAVQEPPQQAPTWRADELAAEELREDELRAADLYDRLAPIVTGNEAAFFSSATQTSPVIRSTENDGRADGPAVAASASERTGRRPPPLVILPSQSRALNKHVVAIWRRPDQVP